MYNKFWLFKKRKNHALKRVSDETPRQYERSEQTTNYRSIVTVGNQMRVSEDWNFSIGTVRAYGWEKFDFKNTRVRLKPIDCSFRSESKTLRTTRAHNASGKQKAAFN